MAELVPILTERELAQLASKSPAEERTYRACVSLPDDWVVFHSLRTVGIEPGEGARDREGDFVVLHPGFGMLVIEVKGGRVEHRNGRWTRVLKRTTKDINDPFAQATQLKHQLLRTLAAHTLWDAVLSQLDPGRMLARHAVLLPDVRDVSVIRGPHIEQELVGGCIQMTALQDWIERAFRFGAANEQWGRLGTVGVELVRTILSVEMSTEAILGFQFDEAEAQRLVLTHEQFVAARALRTSRALTVVGGAGTGKTVLAFRRARESGAAGLRTLLLCYNRPLADALGHERQRLVARGEVLAEHLFVNTFDGFAAWVVERARARGEDCRRHAEDDHPAVEDDSVLQAIAMEYALEDYPLDDVFDVVLVDEAQDFADAHWRALNGILRSARSWCVFLDPDQAVYRRATTSPMSGHAAERLQLTRNCRNTDPVHSMAYRFYQGDVAVEPAALEGPDVHEIRAPNLDGQARQLAAQIQAWIKEEQVGPGRIAVLAMQARTKAAAWDAFERATNRCGVPTVHGRHGDPEAVLFDTVQRFKGLEADVVVLWLNGPVGSSEAFPLRYVGCSRAKTLLVLLGNDRALGEFA